MAEDHSRGGHKEQQSSTRVLHQRRRQARAEKLYGRDYDGRRVRR